MLLTTSRNLRYMRYEPPLQEESGIRYVVCDVIRFVSNRQKYRVKDFLSALVNGEQYVEKRARKLDIC
jgi:hypothetical protein